MNNGEKTSFHHLGLIYHVTEFDDSKIKMDICDLDVSGAEWIELDKNEKMTPFVKRVCTEFRKKILTKVLRGSYG